MAEDKSNDRSGFELTADVKQFIDKMGAAEKALDKLADKAEYTNKRIIDSFNNSANNMDTFINKIETAKVSLDKMNLNQKSIEDFSDKVSKVTQNLDKLTDAVESTEKTASKPIGKDLLNVVAEDAVTVQEKIKTIKKLLAETRNGESSTQRNENLVVLSEQLDSLIKKQKELKAEENKKSSGPIDISAYTNSMESINSVKANIKSLNSLLNKTLKSDSSPTKSQDVKNITNEIEKQKKALTELQIKEDKLNKETKIRSVQSKAALTKETAQIKMADKALKNYISAMGLSENSLLSRTKKINALLSATRALKQTEGDHTEQVKKSIDAVKRLNKANKQSIKDGEIMRSSFKKTGVTLDSLDKKIIAVFTTQRLLKFVDTLLKVRGEFEKQNEALAALLNNRYQANKLFNQLATLAVKSPFQLKDLITYTKQLAAYRVETSKLYGITKQLADVSAGLGVGMDRLILAYGQVKAATYLRGTELRQFSEAGINILGELADKFTELEGRVVTTGEVFERVSKRMVSFQDVSEVFDKLTQKGGLFYKMQEIQAKTLAGEISNLTDSFQIMLNEVGKSQQGVMIGTIHFAKSLMSNYKLIVDIINVLIGGYGLYSAALIYNLFASKAVRDVTSEMIKNYSGLKKVILKVALSFKKLSAAISSASVAKLGWTALIAVVVAAGYAAYTAHEKTERLQKTFNDLNEEIARQKVEFNGLIEKLQDYNSRIKELKEAIGNTKSEEDRIAVEKELADVQKERNRIIIKIKREHPEYVKGIDVEKASQDELNKSAKEYNETLRMQIYLNDLLKEKDTGLFGKGMAGKITNVTDAYSDQEEALNAALSAQQRLIIAINQSIAKAASSEDVDRLKELSKTLSELDPDKFNIGFLQKIEKENKGLFSYGTDLFKDFFNASNVLSELRKTNQEVDKSTNDFASSITEVFKSAVENMKFKKSDVSKMTKEQVKAYNQSVEELKTQIKPVMMNLDINDENVKSIVDDVSKQFLGVSLFSGSIESEKSDYEKAINKMVREVNDGLKDATTSVLPKEVGKSGISQYFTDIRSRVSELKKEIDKFKKGELRPIADVNELQRYNTSLDKTIPLEELRTKGVAALTKVMNGYNKILTAFGEGETKNKKATSSGTSILEKRVSVLKEANSKYNDLLSSMSSKEAKAVVGKDMGGLFSSVGLPSSMDLDTQSIVKQIESIAKLASGKTKQTIEKTLSDLRINLRIDLKQNELDNIKNEISEAFSVQKLTSGMIESGAPKDFVESMFGSSSIDALEKKVRKLLGNATGTEAKKAMNDYLKTISQMRYDANIKDAKAYISNYMASLSDEQKIQEEYERNVSEIKSNSFLSNSQKALAIYRLQVKKQTEIDESRWDKYTKSSNYQRIFDDLDKSTTSSLEHIREELENMIDTADNLTPQSMKTLRGQIKKLDKEISSRNPFKALKKGLKEYREADDELLSAQGNKDKAQSEYNKAVNEFGEDSVEAAKAANKLADAINRLDDAKNGKKEGLSNIKAGIEGINEYVTTATSAISNIFDGLESFGINIDERTKETLAGVDTLSDATTNIMSGNPIQMIQGVGQAVKGFGQVYSGIFGDKDGKKEKEIQKQIELIDSLTEKYEDLSDTIEAAFDIDTLSTSYEAQEKSLKDQNQAYEKMIAAEESKKHTDQDRVNEWTDAIKENNKQIEDLKTSKLESLGGIDIKSAAEEYASSFQDAFFEIGDGYEALMGSMEDQMKNLILKQSMLKISDKFMKPFVDAVNGAIDEDSEGGTRLTANELSDAMEKGQIAVGQLNEAYKQIYSDWGITPSSFSTANLSDLQKGISTVSEDTAGVIEAFLNSLRYSANERLNELVRIRTVLESQYGGGDDNQMLTEVKAIRTLVYQIDSNIASVVKATSTQGGNGLKVFID